MQYIQRCESEGLACETNTVVLSTHKKSLWSGMNLKGTDMGLEHATHHTRAQILSGGVALQL
jgi:hypothetical protein